MKTVTRLFAAAAMLLPGISHAATLTFDSATPGTTLTTYTQDGFTVARESGQFLYGSAVTGQPTTYLNTGYNITGLPGIPNDNTLASLNITEAGGLFSLTSFLYAGFESPSPGGRADGRNSIIVTGFLAGIQAFQQEFLPGTSGSYLTLSPSTSLSFDRVSIATNGRSFGLDSFVVNPAAAAVPEPATWAMMILGFGIAGFAMRRRQQTATVHFA